MRKYETPEIDLACNPVWLKDAKTVLVTLISTGGTWLKTFSTKDGTLKVNKDLGHMILRVTQEDTAQAPDNTIACGMVNVLTESGARFSSDPFKIPIMWNAFDEVIEDV